ncbi:MAG: cytochrome-c peroxidase [Saprospiraceae bacterium]|nr:cytochrome-c peroxidase [Saprospiraceae bacterium]
MEFRSLYFIFWVFLFLSCSDMDEIQVPSNKILDNISIPGHFPEINFPAENAFSSERWFLGKKLFYDTRLSIDSTISCAGCHKQSKGFADDISLTPGVFGRAGVTNAPSLANVAYHPYYTREGGLPTLEMQVLVPISEHNEFGFNIVEIESILKDDIEYQELAMKAYGRALDPFVITRSIATFERSIISGKSKYDGYVNGKAIFSKEEELGKELFFSDKTNCIQCHAGFNFTNYEFKNNGLYETYSHPGRFRLTQKESDLALFKTPSLRNAGFTAPFMHDGSIATLENVVDHYNDGGKPHIHKSNLIKPLGLTAIEKRRWLLFYIPLTILNC